MSNVSPGKGKAYFILPNGEAVPTILVSRDGEGPKLVIAATLLDFVEELNNSVVLRAQVFVAAQRLRDKTEAGATMSTKDNADKGQWTPITDPPKSGEHVLLLCEVKSSYLLVAPKYVCIGFFAKANAIVSKGNDDDAVITYSEEDDEYYLGEGFYEAIHNWDDYNSVFISDSVTHWQPLPEVGGQP